MKNKKENRLLYPVLKKKPNKKWWQPFEDGYDYEYYTLKVNKKGEVILGDKHEE